MRLSKPVATRYIAAYLSLGLLLGLCSPTFAKSKADLSGVWLIETPIIELKTIENKTPPLTRAAKKQYKQHRKMAQKGDFSYDSSSWCASAGMPRMLTLNSPFEIIDAGETAPYIAFLHEWNWWTRVVYMEGALGESGQAKQLESAATLFLGGADPDGPMGKSLGRWQNDTLIIETSQLIDSTLMDNSGLPHSDQLKITEKLRLIRPDVLENRILFEDAATFKQPWETVITYRRVNYDLVEDVCLDRIKQGKPAINP